MNAGAPVAFRSVARVSVGALLIVAALFHLQFALRAFVMAPPQAALVLVAAGALTLAAYRVIKRQQAAHVVFIGTLPLWIVSIAATFIFPDESPLYAVVTGIAPVVAGLIWVFRRARA